MNGEDIFLFDVATNNELGLHERYEAARRLSQMKNRKLPKWRIRVLEDYARKKGQANDL